MNTVDNQTADTGRHQDGTGRPRVSAIKLWIFFGLFFTVAVGMYAGTMYRIQNYGYTGIGKDELAHPDKAIGKEPQVPATEAPAQ